MPSRNEKREGQVPAVQKKNKSSIETLLESMNDLADSAAKNMNAEDLHKTRKEINESIDRVVAGGRQRRRETA
jgi:predicted nucleotide-binding protein (sugar kinase/HSP70/actin superfamily)